MTPAPDRPRFNLQPGPQTDGPLSRRAEWLATAVMVVIFLACGWAFRTPRQAPATPLNPRTIGALHPRIARVEPQDGGVLEIVVDQGVALYEASAVTDLASAALAISAGLKKYFPDAKGTSVRFVGRWQVSGLERFLVNTRMLELTFDRAALMAVDFNEALTFQDLLNYAKAVEYGKPEDKQLVVGFCQDPIALTAGPFCQRALAQAR